MIFNFSLKGIKKLSLIALFVFFIGANLILAQGYQSIYQNNQNVSLMPPSPVAASFQRYGITPVDLQNGLPNISVPLYEVKAGNLSMPITLSYHNNGFKPQEDASWVGLGWNLNIGGVITRVQRGSADNSRPAGRNFDNISPRDSVYNVANNRHKYFMYSTYFDQYYDTEPDYFIFNFPGHSGKFLYVKGKPYFGDFERMKVYKSADDLSFVIIDDNGIEYDFNVYEKSRPKNRTDFYSPTDGNVNCWHLTKMISVDKKHWIGFNYTPYTFTQASYISSQKTKISIGEGFASFDCQGTLNGQSFSTITNSPTGNIVSAFSLDNVQTSEGQIIKLKQSTVTRLDVFMGQNALANLTVYGLPGYSADTVVKKFGFNYGYFTNNLNNIYTTSSLYTRLKLSALYELNGKNDTLSNYFFGYNHELDNFPSKNTFSIDDWGYFNRYDQGILETSLMPKTYFYNEAIDGFPRQLLGTQNMVANKEPDTAYSSYGLLNKIIYPTGGYSTFAFEQNTYGYYQHVGSAEDQIPLYRDTSLYQQLFYQKTSDPNSITKTISRFRMDTAAYVYIYYKRTIWDSLTLPLKNFKPIFYIKNNTNYSQCTDDNIFPHIACTYDTTYRAKLLFTTNDYYDSVYLPAGNYVGELNCENNSFQVESVLRYKVKIVNSSANQASSGIKGPGLRIVSIQNYDAIHQAPVSWKSYLYTDSLNQPSGCLKESPRYQVVETEEVDASGPPNVCYAVPRLYYNVFSDMNSMYNANLNFNFYYTCVKEITADGQAGSFFNEHYYLPVAQTLPPLTVFPYGHFWGTQNFAGAVNEDILISNPVETKTIFWRNAGNSFKKTRESATIYGMIVDTAIIGIKPISLDNYDPISVDQNIESWTYNQYTTYSIWKFPITQTSVDYDSVGNAFTKTIANKYDTTWRALRSTEETINNGKTILTRYKYPFDYTLSNLSSMTAGNIISEPVETQVWQKNSSTDSVLLKGVVTDYHTTLFKPQKKFFLFSSQPLISLNSETKSGNRYTSLLSDTRYSEMFRLTYDGRGNVVEEVSDSAQNIPVSYVWGYGGAYPVAKLTNVRFSSVTAKIDTAAIEAIRNDSTLRAALSPLRTITGSQVATYTYMPFIGMNSATDLNGFTTYYEYESFHRLNNVRDFQNNILKSYFYYYAQRPTSPPVPPPTIVSINCTNLTGLIGFNAVYTNTSTSLQYNFPIPSSGGIIGTIPAGIYNIYISKSSGIFWYSINCNSLSFSGQNASFSNINITSASCNGITIDSNF